MTSTRCSVPALLLLLVAAAPLSLPAQPSASVSSGAITVEASLMPARVKAGATSAVPVTFRLASGFHTNSNQPSDEYLIPLKLTWDAPSVAPLEVAGIDYPAGKLEKYEFSEKPLSVYSGEFVVTTRFRVPATVPKGARTLTGKLRYQACTHTTCYPPKNLAVSVNIAVAPAQ